LPESIHGVIEFKANIMANRLIKKGSTNYCGFLL
jgi:hypothetical protein